MSLRALLDAAVPPLAIPTVYFDTNIFYWVASGKIPAEDWEALRSFLRENAHHRVSLTTLYELLNAVAGSREETFEACKDRFRYLNVLPGTVYGPLSGEFIRTRIFGLKARRQDFTHEALRQCVPFVLRAKARTDLTEGRIVTHPHSLLRWGIDLARIHEQICRGKEDFVKQLKLLSKAPPDALARKRWAARKVIALELERTVKNRLRIEICLDAVYEHLACSLEKARNFDYNFKKHETAWLDSQQLHYLADPTHIFITNDGHLKEETVKSTQSLRIVTFEELLGFARSGASR